MKQASTLYHLLSARIMEGYRSHPAFAGRKPRFKVAVTFVLCLALGIISYSSTFLFP